MLSETKSASGGKKIVIDPVTRIEGHLKIEAAVDNGVVTAANSSGTLFRGFEIILKNRDPRDATQITQRICGVCPICHATASALNLDSAFGIDDKITDNGRILRNLILGSNYLQSHILHFYHLAALDFVKSPSSPPFFPRYEGDYRFSEKENAELTQHYIKALEIRKKSHEMLAIFGGKAPHNVGIIAGGVTEKPTTDKITNFLWRLNEIREFIDNVYIPDVIAVAKKYSDYFEIGAGCKNYLSYGAFDLDGKEKNLLKRDRLIKSGRVSSDLKYDEVDPLKITEDVKHSWYDDAQSHKHPLSEETVPDPEKGGGYSWLKAPRYDGKVYEVGPLARMLVNYVSGDKTVKKLVDSVLSEFKAEPSVLFSVLGRHAARAIETKVVADNMAQWVLELKPDNPVFTEFQIPEESEGFGLTEAPRGALGHWIKIKNKKIENYQCVVPTTWNASPKDDKEQPGPVEQAILGTKVKDGNNPFEIVRIVRSFDPCLACAVHMIDLRGNIIGKFRAF
ncbi:MAG: nickel-dependent hydrogenase large subunit [Elusimicrobia bacterium]|nr:nickel-dependent hydrogenase large subunit [Elusimicrobiota bacterium]